MENTRYSNYYKWENRKNEDYNYERDGLLQHIMSGVIVKTTNSLTRYFLNFYEYSIIFLLKYVDILKNFKNIHLNNR